MGHTLNNRCFLSTEVFPKSGLLACDRRWGDMWQPPQMLMNLTEVGFELFWLPDDFTRTWTETRSMSEPLPTLRTITPQNLAYDLWDAHAFR
jgi:hypothetical protein